MKTNVKKGSKKNFTKSIQRSGISLIVLIVTIIVIILLAVTVILTISKNNVIESAIEANFKEDVRMFQDELAMSVSQQYVNLQGKRNEKLTGNSYDYIKQYIPDFSKKYIGKLAIYNDELVYRYGKINEREEKYLRDIGVNLIIDAKAVESKPDILYGKYITNYKTASEEIDKNVKWKIFHSDGNNIYLISDDYVLNKFFPKINSNNGNNNQYSLDFINEYQVYFSKIANNMWYLPYTNASYIRDNSKASKWIKYVYDYPDKRSSNICETAYLLDDKIWSDFAGEYAEYAIGTPTIEMLLESYNNRYKTSNGFVITEYGYKYTGTNLNQNDNLYVISNTDKAFGLWIASPDNGTSTLYLKAIACNGGIGYSRGDFSNGKLALRPIICLKEDVILKQNESGYELVL